MTDKQKRFVEEYLIDLNATQAAIRAGYSPDTAEQIGHQQLKKTSVANAIAIEQAKRSKRTGVSQDRVVRELAKIAFANLPDIVNTFDGSVIPSADRDDLACIQSIKVKQTESMTEREVKLADKTRALELLGKHLGMFKDRLEVSGLEEEKSKLGLIIEQMTGDGDAG